MKLPSITIFLILTLLLAACSSITTTPSVAIGNPAVPSTQASYPMQPAYTTIPNSSSTDYPAPLNGAGSSDNSAYPAPGSPSSANPAYPAPGSPSSANSAYPAPGSSTSGSNSIPPSGYEPQSGDSSLKQDQVTLDMTTTQVIVTASEPATAQAELSGSMPDACHSLRVEVTPADTTNTIKIKAYSVYDPNPACASKPEPFTASIPLGSYSSGTYSVTVNDQNIGQFDTVFSPQASDAKLTRGEATVDMEGSNLTSASTNAETNNIELTGYLPDPCHQLRLVISPVDANNKINLEVYSVFDSNTMCITVIQPFRVIVPLGVYPSGHYSVSVNGVLLGEFDA